MISHTVKVFVLLALVLLDLGGANPQITPLVTTEDHDASFSYQNLVLKIVIHIRTSRDGTESYRHCIGTLFHVNNASIFLVSSGREFFTNSFRMVHSASVSVVLKNNVSETILVNPVSILVHRNGAASPDFDIAVIKVSRSTLGACVFDTPVGIPTISEEANISFSCKTLIAHGLSTVASFEVANFSIVDQRKCGLSRYHRGTMYCGSTKGSLNFPLCAGSSGQPLLCPLTSVARGRMQTTVLAGYSSRHNCEDGSRFTNLYMKTASHKDWVKNAISVLDNVKSGTYCLTEDRRLFDSNAEEYYPLCRWLSDFSDYTDDTPPQMSLLVVYSQGVVGLGVYVNVENFNRNEHIFVAPAHLFRR
ncbi:unnamed protein product [Soboliphyme baturini]|uniref:Peptidase S1 domain-containing protein n=1 Tax=Soboliphyme baturini TaxID=241478 RepID=A0A183I9J2_9BILA|nr:unnamed protein product [Soboliphyme baturini]